MRVDVDEFQRIRDDVMGSGSPYDAENLEGAKLDGGFGLSAEGFTAPTITETGEPERMVLYASRPDWRPATETEVIERLERGWARIGAFTHDAHSITVAGDVVALDFVTWWDGGAFYTGRIEVALVPES
jgi:hypothetical protein